MATPVKGTRSTTAIVLHGVEVNRMGSAALVTKPESAKQTAGEFDHLIQVSGCALRWRRKWNIRKELVWG